MLARTVGIVFADVGDEVFQIVELLIFLHEPGDRRAAAVGEFRPDIDDHQSTEPRRVLPRQEQTVASTHRMADQNRLL
jgi:hypothetical protein